MEDEIHVPKPLEEQVSTGSGARLGARLEPLTSLPFSLSSNPEALSGENVTWHSLIEDGSEVRTSLPTDKSVLGELPITFLQNHGYPY